MDSRAAANTDPVISPSLLAKLSNPPPGWLCPIEFELGVGDFEGPFVPDRFHISDKLLLQASQMLDRVEKEPIGVKLSRAVTSDEFEFDDLFLQASQQFERSSEESVRKARFSAPVTLKEVESARVSGVPAKTRAQQPGILEYAGAKNIICWCYQLYCELSFLVTVLSVLSA